MHEPFRPGPEERQDGPGPVFVEDRPPTLGDNRERLGPGDGTEGAAPLVAGPHQGIGQAVGPEETVRRLLELAVNGNLNFPIIGNLKFPGFSVSVISRLMDQVWSFLGLPRRRLGLSGLGF